MKVNTQKKQDLSFILKKKYQEKGVEPQLVITQRRPLLQQGLCKHQTQALVQREAFPVAASLQVLCREGRGGDRVQGVNLCPPFTYQNVLKQPQRQPGSL